MDVGAQVAGQILSFGKDSAGKLVDYGSPVEAGTVLARIDNALYAADVAQAKAQLEQSKANVVKAEADLKQMKAKLDQAAKDWARAKKLGPSDALSKSDYDAAQSAFEVAAANLEVGKATITQTKGAVVQNEAALKKAQLNLDYCTIKSPVRGVIIDRRVNTGQTVVSSLNAPSLFLIAKDLRRLQVWISVNEADIGNITPGSPVVFTVDAWGGRIFKGEVGKIRLNATMTQNVVTYTVEVVTDNSDGKLIPYLTANAKFLVNRREGVLMAPNAALRWTPLPERVAPENRSALVVGGAGRGTGGGEADNPAGGTAAHSVVWTPDGGFAKPVRVRTGPTDGSMTEIEGKELTEGMPLIIGEQRKDTTDSPQGGSPFTPKLFGKGGRH